MLHAAKNKRKKTAKNWNEKDVWALVLDGKIDDVIAAGDVGERGKKIQIFAGELWCALERTSKKVLTEVQQAKQQYPTKKQFVKEINSRGDMDMNTKILWLGIYDTNLDLKIVLDEVVKVVRKNCATATKLEKVRESLAEGVRFVW